MILIRNDDTNTNRINNNTSTDNQKGIAQLDHLDELTLVLYSCNADNVVQDIVNMNMIMTMAMIIIINSIIIILCYYYYYQ